MDCLNHCASIAMCEIKRTLTYNDTPMLTLCISYPKVTLRHCPCAQESINANIQAQVYSFLHAAYSSLYQQAIETYRQSRQNDFPFRRYEAILQYNITYNQDCYLSLYRDQYQYTGGAHGSTTRMFDTWNLMNGCNIPLSCLFPAGQDYRASLIEQVTRQATQRARQNPVFFEEYPALIAQYFDEDRYYLTCRGVAIYFQQYEIAPYSTGIVVFTIPYQGASGCSGAD